MLQIIPVVGLAILIAPYINDGIVGVINNLTEIARQPFNLIWCENSLKIVSICICFYILAISIYESTKKELS
ncbi:MAG: hypothetical protein V8R51_05755 [Clostridia bacterium]